MKEELSAFSVSNGLNTSFIGRRVVYYPKLPSTMAVAREEALAGAAEGAVVIAGEQTAGRGRMERRWISPAGSISLSIILYPSPSILASLVMAASLAVVKAIESVTGLKAQIKWPNDILINGRKVCGILVESGVDGKGKTHAVIGIGINANVRVKNIGDVLIPATSLSDELGDKISHVKLVRRLLVEIERLYLSTQHSEDVYKEWRDNLVTIDKKVRAVSGKDVYEGIAESVNEDGSLLIRLADGNQKRFAAGDVTLQG